MKGASLAAVVLSCAALHGQTALLTGRITDPSRAIVPDARVTVFNPKNGTVRRTLSNEQGYYGVPLLQPGSYDILVQSDGFKPVGRQSVVLTVDQVCRIDFMLPVGEMAQRVDVESRVNRTDTDTTTIQQLVDSKRVEQLPLNGRNVYQLAKLVPGTGTSGFNIGGGREGTWGTTTNVRLDGGINTDGAWNVIQSSPSPDAVQEFSIQTSVPSAKYGWSAGVIEVATKAGTNELHGTLYEFLRNDVLNGRNFFAATQSKLKRNQYGVAVGGPVWIPKLYDGRNKLFWFVNWEQQKQPATTLSTIFVPTAKQRQGDFSEFSAVIRDPLTNQPFPNKIVPASRLDTIANNVISKFVPLPQDSTGLYRYQYPSDSNPQQVMGRMDYQWGANQFMYRVFWTDSSTNRPRGSLPYFSDAGRTFGNTINDAFSFTRIVTPRLLNVFRFSYNTRVNGSYSLEKERFDLSALQSMGWSQNYYSPVAVFPELTVSGHFKVGDYAYNWADDGDTYYFDDDLSWNRGRHGMQFGFHFGRVTQRKRNEGLRLAGAYAFTGQFSGLDLADFMLGRPASFVQQGETNLWNRSNSFAGYFQDDIKVSSRLTLNTGVRYELPLAPANLLNQVSFFFPGDKRRSQRFVNAPPGLLYQGDPGMPDKSRETPKTLFGPRIGLAYALTADQKTVLRVAYGIMYNPSWLQEESHFSERPPFLIRVDMNAPPSTADPWANYPGGNPFPGAAGSSTYVYRAVSGRAYAPGFTEANMQQWNINIQRELARNYLVKVAYVGTKGTHLMQRNDINAAIYIPGKSTLANLNDRRPYAPEMGAIDWISSDGNSSYHSAQFSLGKRFSHGFSVMSAYTFSKAIDTQSSGWANYPQNPNDWAAERSPSTMDRTHVFNTSWVWAVPSLTGLPRTARYLMGGWEVTGILSIYSGPALSMTSSVDNALLGTPNRPDRLRDPRLDTGRSLDEKLMRYFDTTVYAVNGVGQFGSAPRVEGQLYGPGQVTLDAGVVKHFPFSERHHLDFRAEFFNLPNHARFNSPGTTIGTSSFGRITSAGDPRIVQFALKLAF